jgi:saccharopine dehydrogenase-like NADP-dependent oxidoreductase
MKILVLGGGAQGKVIANDLASSLPDATIRVADIREPERQTLPNLRWMRVDLGTSEDIARALWGFDLAVGALPARLGFRAIEAAVTCCTPIVDVSFSSEDPMVFDAKAKSCGTPVLVDCGLAPGLSNLIVGRAVEERGIPQEITIYVGGVAQDRDRPYGYVVTWALGDLLEGYTRPARIRRQGEQITVPVFSGLERIQVDGVGEMEAFYTDGLRSLLHTFSDVPERGEKTLRWPGHAEAVRSLVAGGTLIEEFEKRCVVEEALDLVALVVRVRWSDGSLEATLVDRHDPATGLTAMSRATAFTSSIAAQLVATGEFETPGVLPLELVGSDERAYRFVLEEMQKRGVRIDIRKS